MLYLICNMLSIQEIPNYAINEVDRKLILLEKALNTTSLFMKKRYEEQI